MVCDMYQMSAALENIAAISCMGWSGVSYFSLGRSYSLVDGTSPAKGRNDPAIDDVTVPASNHAF